MHPTAGQLSGRNSAASSRFAKSAAYTIATSDGRPDPAQSVRHARARLCVRLLRRPTLSSPAFVRGSGWAQSGCCPASDPTVYSLLTFLGASDSIGHRQPSGMRFWRRTGWRARSASATRHDQTTMRLFHLCSSTCRIRRRYTSLAPVGRFASRSRPDRGN
jgi:hypothetical protein